MYQVQIKYTHWAEWRDVGMPWRTYSEARDHVEWLRCLSVDLSDALLWSLKIVEIKGGTGTISE